MADMDANNNNNPNATAPIPQNVRQWSSPVFGCLADIKTCLCGMFFLPCLECQVASRLNEPCMSFCFPANLRTKLRTQYGIQGDVYSDGCGMACCGPFLVCQMDRELTALGV